MIGLTNMVLWTDISWELEATLSILNLDIIEVKNNTQEINLLRVYQALIPIERCNGLLIINNKCVHKVLTKVNNVENKQHKIFVNEVETQDEKNHSGAVKLRKSIIQETKLDTR